LHKQLFHIKNDEADTSAPQVLSIRIGERHCGFVITNQSGDVLHELRYYACDLKDANPLPAIAEENENLKKSFYKVVVSYDFPESVLAPSLFYKHDDAGLLLKSLYGVNGSSTIISEQVKSWQLHNIYAVPKELHEWITRQFSSARFWHQYSISLKNVQASTGTSQLMVDFRTNELTVIAFNEKTVVLTQTFPYSTPEDVLYHLLKVCKQFGFSQENVQVNLSGLVDQNSALYKELYQYFIHIQFRTVTWQQSNDEYPLHFFTSLNGVVQCE
jgi:hypothetical protein